jgi:hypothetical protein
MSLIEEMHKVRCSDGGCIFRDPNQKIGMQTNGGCRCLEGLPIDKRIVLRKLVAALKAPTSCSVTDEEIEDAAEDASVNFHEYINTYFIIAFEKGAKWMRDKLVPSYLIEALEHYASGKSSLAAQVSGMPTWENGPEIARDALARYKVEKKL